jgi:hypothetical protein
MARLFSILALVVGGVIVADILIHPAGVTAASAGTANIEKPALNALLGASS